MPCGKDRLEARQSNRGPSPGGVGHRIPAPGHRYPAPWENGAVKIPVAPVRGASPPPQTNGPALCFAGASGFGVRKPTSARRVMWPAEQLKPKMILPRLKYEDVFASKAKSAILSTRGHGRDHGGVYDASRGSTHRSTRRRPIPPGTIPARHFTITRPRARWSSAAARGWPACPTRRRRSPSHRCRPRRSMPPRPA